MYALRRVDLKEEKLRLSAATESAFFFFFFLSFYPSSATWDEAAHGLGGPLIQIGIPNGISYSHSANFLLRAGLTLIASRAPGEVLGSSATSVGSRLFY